MEGATVEASQDGSKSLSSYGLNSSFCNDLSSTGLDASGMCRSILTADPSMSLLQSLTIAGIKPPARVTFDTSEKLCSPPICQSLSLDVCTPSVSCSEVSIGHAVTSLQPAECVLWTTATEGSFVNNFVDKSSGQRSEAEGVDAPVIHKKRGCWTKGKKRKFQNDAIRPPKAPYTGYTVFAKKRRAQLIAEGSSLSFAEMATTIGHEWSYMTEDEKKPFLQAAAADSQRYRKELDDFKLSEAFQLYSASISGSEATRKPNNHLRNTTAKSNGLLDEANEFLLCTLCNVSFTNLHNKAEHMKGRQHHVKLYERLEKLQSSKFDTTSQFTMSCKGKTDDPLNLDEFIAEFVRKNSEREMELETLKERVDVLKAKKQSQCELLKSLRERECGLQQLKSNQSISLSKAQSQLDSLLSFQNSCLPVSVSQLFVVALPDRQENNELT